MFGNANIVIHTMSPQGRPSGGTNRFFASYYVANGLLVASYGLIRLWHIRHNAGFYSRLQKPSDIIEKVGLVIVIPKLPPFRVPTSSAFSVCRNAMLYYCSAFCLP